LPNAEKMHFLLVLALAVVYCVWSPDHAHAGALGFGSQDSISHIVDIDARGPNGESLFLGYRLRATVIGAPILMSDEGSVLGVTGDTTRYFALAPARIADMQSRGQLPRPLPPYSVKCRRI
jgi:uncharacterized protein